MTLFRWLSRATDLPPWVVIVALATGGIWGWLSRPPRLLFQPARGKVLDRIALDRFDMVREGWREKLPLLGDGRFRARVRRAYKKAGW